MLLPEKTSNVLQDATDRLASLRLAHFIAGEFREDPTEDRTPIINPATAEVLGHAPNGSSETVDAAVRTAREAQKSWKQVPPGERAAMLLALADKIDEHAELFTQLESLNGGKPILVAREEIPGASDALRFFAGACRSLQAPASGEYVHGQTSILRREPIGVIGAVSPWNYPLMMAVWKIAPALAAGNAIVLKPSEQTPLTTLLLAELSIGIVPAGLLNIVLGTGPVVGEALSHHPGIGLISLTGSVRSGQAVARGAASTLKRVHLELGGKAPVVVFADADLNSVVETIRVAGLWNTGQECGAATRVLCHEEVAEELVERVRTNFEEIAPGNPADSADLELGPLTSEAQLRRVIEKVERVRDEGATIVTGGTRVDRAGYFYSPTLITNAPEGSEILREEVFGPVVTVETFRDETEAIEKANAVEYGLAASVWTTDLGRSLRVSGALDFGTVWVNSHLTLASEMPWGGFGSSGYGNDNSILALDDYSRFKHVVLAHGELEGR